MICDRCKKPTITTMMSLFNTQMICNICQLKERSHPDFQKARDAELDSISKGDTNFPGIGLPPELEGGK